MSYPKVAFRLASHPVCDDFSALTRLLRTNRRIQPDKPVT